jgi:hypothetical protein
VRGWQLNLGHLADSFGKLDGTGRVLDPAIRGNVNAYVASFMTDFIVLT